MSKGKGRIPQSPILISSASSIDEAEDDGFDSFIDEDHKRSLQVDKLPSTTAPGNLKKPLDETQRKGLLKGAEYRLMRRHTQTAQAFLAMKDSDSSVESFKQAQLGASAKHLFRLNRGQKAGSKHSTPKVVTLGESKNLVQISSTVTKSVGGGNKRGGKTGSKGRVYLVRKLAENGQSAQNRDFMYRTDFDEKTILLGTRTARPETVLRKDSDGEILKRSILGSTQTYHDQSLKAEMADQKARMSMSASQISKKRKVNRFARVKINGKDNFVSGIVTRDGSSADILAKHVKPLTLKERLSNAFKMMIEDKVMQTGKQDFDQVKRVVERRLQRAHRAEVSNKATSSRDKEKQASMEYLLKGINYAQKPNFLVNRAQSRQVELGKPVLDRGNARRIPVRVLLKETFQERVLDKHQNYSNQWTSQIEQREQRYLRFMQKKDENSQSKECLKGLPGGGAHLSDFVKSSTGSKCGLQQKVSILDNTDSQVQVKAAREAVAQSKKFEGDAGKLPVNIWYDCLRNNSHSPDHQGSESRPSSIERSTRHFFSTSARQSSQSPLKSTLNSRYNTGPGGSLDQVAHSATYSIPQRKAHLVYMARGQKVFAQKDKQVLAVARPNWTSKTFDKEKLGNGMSASPLAKSGQGSLNQRKIDNQPLARRPATQAASSSFRMSTLRRKRESSIASEDILLDESMSSLNEVMVKGVPQFYKEVHEIQDLPRKSKVCLMNKLHENTQTQEAEGDPINIKEYTFVEHCSPELLF